MEQIKIALGTTSKWKINFVKKVLKDIGIEVEIIPVKTDSKGEHKNKLPCLTNCIIPL